MNVHPGHVGGFRFGYITNGAALDILSPSILVEHKTFLLDKYLREMVGSHSCMNLGMEGPAKRFFRVASHLQPPACGCSSCRTPSPATGRAVPLPDCSHSGRICVSC